MSNLMHYKGYDASVELSDEGSLFFGKVEGIRSLISFEGSDVDSLKQSFEDSVEAYLVLCQKKNVDPEKPYKGSINVRIKPENYRLIFRESKRRNSSINSLINEAIEREYARGGQKSSQVIDSRTDASRLTE
jgi:predicted HicB family RNase H-like nuclease